MKTRSCIKPHTIASLALATFLTGSASAAVTVTTSNQQGTASVWPFTPSWTPDTNKSLIVGLTPSRTVGNFNLEPQAGTRTPNSLSVNTDLSLNKLGSPNTSSPNYVTCGNGGGAGSLLVYTLPASPYGYNLTNITVYGGWADNGRDALGFTVQYSTVDQPASFKYLATVSYNPVVPGNTASANRAVISDSLGGLIASNVAALQFDFTLPQVENGFTGYGAITVGGTAATSAFTHGLSLTTANQNNPSAFTPSWPVDAPSLLTLGQLPATASGNFTLETSGGTQVLTDGVLGQSGTVSTFATAGAGAGSGSSLIYALPNMVNGSDVTNIVVYSGWGNANRDGQYYLLSYSTVSAPTTYLPLTTIYYNPQGVPGASANRVALAMTDGTPLGSGVANLKFDFGSVPNGSQFDNGYCGISEIVVQGRDTAAPPPPPSPYLTADTAPRYAETFVGDQVVFTAAFSNVPPANVQWLFVSGGVTNVIAGATSSTLTLNNVQLTDAGTYLLKAVNATNSAAAPSFSSAATLAVGNVPAAVGGMIVTKSAQSGWGSAISSTNFYPTWTINLNNDLILNSVVDGSGTPGTATAGAGSYSGGSSAGDPTVLTDGSFGYLNYWPNVGGSPSLVSLGGGGMGESMTYTLPANSANGYDLSSITVFGGWGDTGRNEQKYQVLYSTIDNPTYFRNLLTVDYNPANAPAGVQSATRTTVLPGGTAGTVLAKNVYAVRFSFIGFALPKNNWEGYSEIIVAGTPSQVNPVLVRQTLPSYQETVVGDQVRFAVEVGTAPAANLQWQFVSTNNLVTDIPGATSATLTLNNVQLTDTGSYQLKAADAANPLNVVYSAPGRLVVGNAITNGNILLQWAGQCGLGGADTTTDFYPNWTVNTNDDLIAGFTAYFDQSVSVPEPGYLVAGPGNYTIDPYTGVPTTTGDPAVFAVLSDGAVGPIIWAPGTGASPALLACGSSTANPGSAMTYALITNAAPYGFDITNITVYGGWSDAGRNEQKYQILYSTVSAPTTFNSLITADYNPADPDAWQTATRVRLVPINGVLAQNVYAVKINWLLQGNPPKNGWEAYSEIVVNGKASAPKPVLVQDITPLTADDVVGSSLTLAANFTSATSMTYQWQKDGANLPGATQSSLTLANLQLTDTATNGGYRLQASNASGTSVSRGCSVIVNPVPAAVGNVIVSFAHQSSDGSSFAPTWDTSTFASSLIYYAWPFESGTGNFNDPDVNPISSGLAGGLPVLTDDNYGVNLTTGAHPAFATCGPNAGQYVVYALPASANGYDLTNILVASGWNDANRDGQWETISYATVGNPTTFLPIASFAHNPPVTGLSEIRATVTPASGVLAHNAAYVKVDFTTPGGMENAYVGISQINVFGAPSANNNAPIVTVANEATDTPSWVVETDNLIAHRLPSAVGAGSFAGGFNGEAVTGGLPVLTDGTFGPFGLGSTNFATCGGAYGAGAWVTYTCPDGSWTITNIVTYSGWGNYDRDGQFYKVYYTTWSDPNTQVPLATVTYNPPSQGAIPAANRVGIALPDGGALATNVYSVTFDFTSQAYNLDNGYSGYAELVLQGTKLAAPIVIPPTVHAPKVSGGNLILTGTGGTPNQPYTWLSTTNLAAPIHWTTNSTGNLDGFGAFSNAIPINASQPGAFFRLRLP